MLSVCWLASVSLLLYVMEKLSNTQPVEPQGCCYLRKTGRPENISLLDNRDQKKKKTSTMVSVIRELRSIIQHTSVSVWCLLSVCSKTGTARILQKPALRVYLLTVSFFAPWSSPHITHVNESYKWHPLYLPQNKADMLHKSRTATSEDHMMLFLS